MTVYQFLQKLAPYTGYKIIGENFESRPYRKGKYFGSSELKYFPKVISRIDLVSPAPNSWIYIYTSNEECADKEPITYQDLLNIGIQANTEMDINDKHFWYIKEIAVENNTIIVRF